MLRPWFPAGLWPPGPAQARLTALASRVHIGIWAGGGILLEHTEEGGGDATP